MSQNNSIAFALYLWLNQLYRRHSFLWFGGVKLGATYMIHILFIMVGGGIGVFVSELG